MGNSEEFPLALLQLYYGQGDMALLYTYGDNAYTASSAYMYAYGRQNPIIFTNKRIVARFLQSIIRASELARIHWWVCGLGSPEVAGDTRRRKALSSV